MKKLLGLATLLAIASPAFAQSTWSGVDYTWTNTGDSNSFTPAWNSGDSVILTNNGITNATVGQTAISLTGNTTIGSLTLQTSTSRLTSGTVGTNQNSSSGFNYLIQSDANETISGSGSLNLNGGVLIFDRPNTSPDGNVTHNFSGALNYTGSNYLNLRSQSATRAVSLQVASLANPTAGNTIAFGQMNSASDSGTSGLAWNTTNTRVIVTGTKPTPTTVGPNNVNMVSGGLQFIGTSTPGNFMKLDGNNLIPLATGDYNVITSATSWTTLGATSVANATTGTTLTANATVHAARIEAATNLGGFTLNVTGGLSVGNNNFTNGTVNFGSNHAFISVWNPSTANNNFTVNVATTAGMTLFGNNQEINFTGANTGLSGGIYLNAAATRFGATSANNNVVTIASIGQLIVSGASGAGQTTTIGGLAGSGYVSGYNRTAGNSSSTLEINVASGSFSSSAIIRDGAPSTGTGRQIGISKTGAGTQIFTGTGSYTGTTAVSAGTLLINGNFTAAVGAVSATGTGTLGGTGSIGGAVTVGSGATLSPGASIESFATGALSLTNASTFAYEVDSGASLASAADLQVVNGALNLTGTVTLTLTNLDLTPVAFAPNTTFSLINYSGAWNGGLFTFGGNELSDGATFTAGGTQWTIDYDASSGGVNFTGDYIGGNYVNLTAAIPEPGTWALTAFGLTATLIFRRRRAGVRLS